MSLSLPGIKDEGGETGVRMRFFSFPGPAMVVVDVLCPATVRFCAKPMG